ncbi:MAG: hypothetical protein R3D55_25855 [Chloroflexota bacterium]
MSAKGEKTHRYQVRLQDGTADGLAEMAAALGFFVDTPGRYHGAPSAGDLLDVLVEKFRGDQTAVIACLRGAGIEGEPQP